MVWCERTSPHAAASGIDSPTDLYYVGGFRPLRCTVNTRKDPASPCVGVRLLASGMLEVGDGPHRRGRPVSTQEVTAVTHALRVVATTASPARSAHRPSAHTDREERLAKVAARRRLFETMKREAMADITEARHFVAG